MRAPADTTGATTRVTITEEDGSTVSFAVTWQCACRHHLRGHRGSQGRCNHCQCETFRAAGYRESYLAELDELPNARLVAPDATLLAQVLARVETLAACRSWETQPTYMAVHVTYQDTASRLITEITITFAEDITQVEGGESAIAAAILGPAPVVLGVAGHRGRELYGVDVDGRRYLIGRCRCCGAWERSVITPAELSRRDSTHPARSARADHLATRLAALLPVGQTLEPLAEAAAPVSDRI